MRWLGVLLIGLAIVLPLHAEDWTTADGKTYKNVTVLNQEDDGVRITYTGGVGKIPYYELPVDIQKRFGQDIDSLAAKKRAVDQALEEAVTNAIAAEQMKQPQEPGAANQPAVPAPVNPSTAPANGVSANTAPAGGPENQPSNGAVNPAPGSANQANASNGSPSSVTQPGGAPARNGAPANGAPGTATAAAGTGPGSAQAAAHGAPGVAANGGRPGAAGSQGEGMPALNDYAPGQGGGPAPEASPYPGSKVTYNEALDLCYLDSPAVDLITAMPPQSGSKASNPTASLTLRVVTEGRKPAKPDKIEATYLAVGGANQASIDSSVTFTVDGKEFAIDDSAKKDSGTMGGVGQSLFYLTFYLTPDQLKSITGGTSVQVNVSPTTYKFNANGMAFLQAYQKDIDVLPAGSSSVLRSYYKLLAKIPSFVSMVSTFCEYLILGSFALLVCASIAAFVMGVTRFIKM